MEHKVTLLVGGRDYYGWLSVQINADLEQITRTFNVSLTKLIDLTESAQLAIKLGDDVVVKIDNKPVLTGYIDAIEIEQNSTSLSILIKGKSKTGVLNDCTAPDTSSKSWKQQTISKIVKEMAALYDINVIDEVGLVDKKDYTIAVDKTIGSAITDLQKNASFLITDDEHGNLVVVNKKRMLATKGKISIGDNVISSNRKSLLSGRFSRYVAIGQGRNPHGEVENTNALHAEAEDDSVTRKRVKVFKVTGSVTTNELQKRVDLTRDYMSGAGETIDYVVPGWYNQDSELWRIGTTVHVKDSLATGDEKTVPYVVKSVEFSLNSNGTQSKITVRPEIAYTGTDYTTFTEAVEASAKKKASKAKASKKTSKKTVGESILKKGSGIWNKSTT